MFAKYRPPSMNIAKPDTPKPPVVLLHGLARTRRSMLKLERALAADYLVGNISYPSTKHRIETLVSNFVLPSIAQFLKKNGLHDDTPLHFVTHSMGGIILRVLAKTTPINIHHAVMLAPPNQGSEATDTLGKLAPYAWINGPAGMQLATSANNTYRLTSLPRQLGSLNFNCGIIAGDNSTLHLTDPISHFMPKPSDGKVSVASTKIAGMADHLVVVSNHTFIMDKPEVVAQVKAFLANGAFIVKE